MRHVTDSTITNFGKRLLGVIVCFLPIWLITASAIYTEKLSSLSANLILSLALLIAAFNFYLSFIRPWLYKRRYGYMDGYKFVSGILMIGTLLVIIGLTIGFRAIVPTFLAGAVAMLDTGGSPWFLFATWRDRSFWENWRLNNT